MLHKIRTPIIWFGIFVCLMLFQTSFMKLGTITAFSTLVMIVITTFLGKYTSIRKFKFPIQSKCMLIFVILCTVTIMISGYTPNYFMRFIAQIFLFLVLLTLRLNFQEKEFIEKLFIIAAVIYAILTIYSCIQNRNIRYIHSSILLFNTEIDPNFIGIPFVAASSIVLDKILIKKKKIINFSIYFTLIIAIVYTASRSNLICFIFSNMLIILNFLRKKETSLRIRIFWILLFIVVVIFGIRIISIRYSDQWSRMIEFGENSDNGRFDLWKQSFLYFFNSPLWGNGLGYMVLEYGKATHNTYIQLLCETGIIGFLLFMSIILTTLKKIRNYSIYLVLYITLLLQIAFLDALDNRCFWIVMCWLNMLPSWRKKNGIKYKKIHI